MDIQIKKLDLIEWIIQLNDVELLSKIKNIRDNSLNIISEEEKKSINKGLKDIKEGKTHSYEEVKKVYEKYL